MEHEQTNLQRKSRLQPCQWAYYGLVLYICFCFQQIAFMAKSQHHHINSRDSLACNLSLSKSHIAYNTKLSLTDTSHFNSNSLFFILDLLKIHKLIPHVNLQLSFSNVLPIHLGSKLLTDPSTTKLLLSGSHCSIQDSTIRMIRILKFVAETY